MAVIQASLHQKALDSAGFKGPLQHFLMHHCDIDSPCDPAIDSMPVPHTWLKLEAHREPEVGEQNGAYARVGSR